jgi:hypothetical protein
LTTTIPTTITTANTSIILSLFSSSMPPLVSPTEIPPRGKDPSKIPCAYRNNAQSAQPHMGDPTTYPTTSAYLPTHHHQASQAKPTTF